jgi:excisionase family DNA binding protein
MLTVAQAAERLGMKPATIRMWIAKRKLAHVKLARAVRVPESEVERMIWENTIPARVDRR